MNNDPNVMSNELGNKAWIRLHCVSSVEGSTIPIDVKISKRPVRMVQYKLIEYDTIDPNCHTPMQTEMKYISM